MSKAFTILVALATLSVLLPPGAVGSCGYTTSESLAAGGFYVATDDDGMWIYQETNDIGGLQRRDSAHDDTAGCIEPDELLL